MRDYLSRRENLFGNVRLFLENCGLLRLVDNNRFDAQPSQIIASPRTRNR